MANYFNVYIPHAKCVMLIQISRSSISVMAYEKPQDSSFTGLSTDHNDDTSKLSSEILFVDIMSILHLSPHISLPLHFKTGCFCCLFDAELPLS